MANKERKEKRGVCVRYMLGKIGGIFFPLEGLAVNAFIGGWAVHSLGFCGRVACSYVAFLGACFV